MISRRMLVLGALPAGGLALGILPALAKSSGGPMASLDTDNDGTLDLAEAKKAASAMFDKLDKDHDGTLTKSEIGRRMSAKDFKSGDPDNDGTLTKDEYLAAWDAADKEIQAVKRHAWDSLHAAGVYFDHDRRLWLKRPQAV